MNFLLINTDYDPFMQGLYRDHPALASQPYAEQHRTRMDTLFGTADFMSSNLRKLGHYAIDVIANLQPAQRMWAKENNINVPSSNEYQFRLRRGFVPWINRRQNNQWLFDILEAQIKAYKPDVLYCMAMETIGSDFLDRVRPYIGMAVGQHAAPLPTIDINGYDLVVSSLPNQVDYFRAKGINSHYLPLSFEPGILDHIEQRPKKYDVTFVGGLAGPHEHGTRLLELLCENFNVNIWGYGQHQLPASSIIHKAFHGPVFGRDMYQTLADSKIVINRHIAAAENYANNMRLFETTGVGTCLVTDQQQNLADLFAPGKQVASYRNHEDCVQTIDELLRSNIQRQNIANAGQIRTLTDHTYEINMAELIDIINDSNSLKYAA